MSNSTTITAFTALIAGMVSIAWSAIFVRWTNMPGIASAFYRVLIATAALWTILLVRKRGRIRIPLSAIPLSAMAGVFFAADVGLFNIAVFHTSAGNATFLSNNTPIIVGLLTWFTTGRFPSFRFWSALLIAAVGACLIVSVNWSHLPSASFGDLLAAIASLCFALYLITTERSRTMLDTLTIVTLSTTSSAAVLLVIALGANISLAVPGTHSLLAVAGLGLICQLSGYLCLTYALGHIPATISAMVLLAVAPLTALFAFFFFHEAMAPVQFLGGSLILIAVWIVTNQSSTSRMPPP